jgi:hypothetical protein
LEFLEMLGMWAAFQPDVAIAAARSFLYGIQRAE